MRSRFKTTKKRPYLTNESLQNMSPSVSLEPLQSPTSATDRSDLVPVPNLNRQQPPTHNNQQRVPVVHHRMANMSASNLNDHHRAGPSNDNGRTMSVQSQHVQQIRQTNFGMVPNWSGQQQSMLQLIRGADDQQRPVNNFNPLPPLMARNNDDDDLPFDVGATLRLILLQRTASHLSLHQLEKIRRYTVSTIQKLEHSRSSLTKLEDADSTTPD